MTANSRMLSFSSGAEVRVGLASAKRALVPPMSATSTGACGAFMRCFHGHQSPMAAEIGGLEVGPSRRRGRVAVVSRTVPRHC